ncbi:MAG: hypothetical protein M1530_00560 [Candidatus Marsarchaeota archaeon]|nr:hypothetical protein [Candidatus Marsarchaeota archaeon]
MDATSNKSITLAALAGGLLCLAAAWVLGEPLALLPAALLFFLSLLVWRLGWMLGPALASASRLRVSEGDCEFPPSQDVMLQRTSGGWRASVCLGVQLRDSATLSTQGQQALMMELFEKAIGGLRYPLSLTLLVCPLDTSQQIQRLEERRSLSEHRRARLRGPKDSDEAAKLERDIESCNAQIRRLTGGERPMKVSAWALTTAAGLTREEALQRARSQAQEASAVLSGSLSCSVAPLRGEEFLRAAEWQKWIPMSKEELEDQTF